MTKMTVIITALFEIHIKMTVSQGVNKLSVILVGMKPKWLEMKPKWPNGYIDGILPAEVQIGTWPEVSNTKLIF